jgi:hypothetical protein
MRNIISTSIAIGRGRKAVQNVLKAVSTYLLKSNPIFFMWIIIDRFFLLVVFK